MKKLFFFRSSNKGNKNEVPPSSLNNQIYCENNPSESGIISNEAGAKAEHNFRNPSTTCSGLRKSCSLSSTTFLADGLEQKNFSFTSDNSISPLSNASGVFYRRRGHSSTTPERLSKANQSSVVGIQNANGLERAGSSGSSCSSNISSEIVDFYVGGEQQLEKITNNSSFQRDHIGNGNGAGNESPRRLAKNIIEKLSQIHFPKSSSKVFRKDVPITIGDILSYETAKGYVVDNFSGFEKQHYFWRDDARILNSIEKEDDIDVELRRRSKEAQERLIFLSEEVEQERFLQDSRSDASMLILTIRDLLNGKRSLALEVANLIESQIADRASAKVEHGQTKRDFESQMQRIEKEKNELQLTLEKELDRRSADWSLKLEKYRSEEHKLHERVRKLAEHNVSLQKEVYSFNERDVESGIMITHSKQQLRDLTSRVEELSKHNRDLSQNLTQLQGKYGAVEEDIGCVKRSFEEKDKECKELQKSIAQLLRTCREQENTIDGLREGFDGEIGTKQQIENFDKLLVGKVKMEQMRLIGVELALRKERESFRLEVDSLRQENIDLLNRLKGSGKEIDALTFKLDKEISNHVFCLQNEGLSILKESGRLCSKLLEFIKGKGNQLLETKQDAEVVHNGLDAQFIVESEMKIHGFKQGTDGLTRSLQNISSLLQEKSSLVASKCSSVSINPDGLARINDQPNDQISKETLRFTSLLREKLCSKELEVEELHVELATIVRGNDNLRCEVQHALLDNLSRVTHKFKDLELQMLRKDEKISQLQSDLQETLKELTVMKGILPKVSEERDLMQQEAKQYNEKNMLLNSEVHALEEKIEALEEDVLLKEGQITILKDALRSPNSSPNFRLA